MQRGRIHSQDGVVLTLQIQPSPLAPRRERRFSLPRNVPSGEERSGRVRCIGKLGSPGFLNTGETSERFQFARTAPSWATRTSLHTGVISDAVLLSRHPGISSDTQALLGSRLLRALSHSRFLSLCRDWELQVDGGAASLVKHRLIKKKSTFSEGLLYP